MSNTELWVLKFYGDLINILLKGYTWVVTAYLLRGSVGMLTYLEVLTEELTMSRTLPLETKSTLSSGIDVGKMTHADFFLWVASHIFNIHWQLWYVIELLEYMSFGLLLLQIYIYIYTHVYIRIDIYICREKAFLNKLISKLGIL